MFSRENSLKIKLKIVYFLDTSAIMNDLNLQSYVSSICFIPGHMYTYTSMTLTWKSRKVKVTGFLRETELADMMDADKMLLLMKEVLRLVIISSSMFW